ncbi:MAG: SAF domain-containing protein [Pseudonocardiales bacterium]
MRTALVDLLARLNRWPRRLAALSFVVLAGASALAARRPDAAGPGNATDVRVVVAARDLGVSTALTSRDLTIVAWPRQLVPTGAASDTRSVVGRRLAGPLRKREAVTTTRLVGADLTAGLAVGEVATALSIEADLATVLRAGDHVDVLAGAPLDAVSGSAASPGAAAVLVAEAAAVLAVLPASDVVGGAGSTQILIVTDRATAVRLVALQGRRVLAVVLSPP